MKRLKSLFVAALMCVSTSGFANTFLSDMSDLWWNANESGWGVTVTHQGEVVFLTFFIYGADGKASWYTGQGTYGGKNSQGAYIFTGPVYQVTGPWFGATSFNPANVGARAAGNMTLTAFLNSATLAYTIDGVNVTKAITRQTFRINELLGEYKGAMKSTQAGCRAPYVNGDFNDAVDFSVTNTSSTFSMRVTYPDTSFCAFTGNYAQSGRFGSSTGTYICTGGVSGTYDAVEIEANISGFIGRYSSSDNFCSSITGRFAGMKK